MHYYSLDDAFLNLTRLVVQVKTFIAALRALSRREVQYGAYATSEEVWLFTRHLILFSMLSQLVLLHASI
jgi:hypothetical protein